MSTTNVARAFAPASVGNVAVGFDCLGHAIQGLGDTAEAHRSVQPGVRILEIRGIVSGLPKDNRNTAVRAVEAMLAASDSNVGIDLIIDKGIPLGSGLGGSASSAVAALVAANAVLGRPFKREQLYTFAVEGEAVASGAKHGDNVGPQLLGGLVLTSPDRCISLPLPPNLQCVVAHPDMILETRTARKVLAEPFAMSDIVKQIAAMGTFVTACFRSDMELLRESLIDVLVEPRRAALIPGFFGVKAAAISCGAIGASISGAGPSVFAWFERVSDAQRGAGAMQAAFAQVGLVADIFISPLACAGAKLL
jgi:homoserine kinase